MVYAEKRRYARAARVGYVLLNTVLGGTYPGSFTTRGLGGGLGTTSITPRTFWVDEYGFKNCTNFGEDYIRPRVLYPDTEYTPKGIPGISGYDFKYFTFVRSSSLLSRMGEFFLVQFSFSFVTLF